VTNRDFQQARADQLQRVLIALIRRDGPITLAQGAIAAIGVPVPDLTTTTDPTTGAITIAVREPSR
jgi:hypothetical protein